MADIFDEIEDVEVKPSEKAQQIAKSFKFYGYEPKPSTIEAVRKPLVQKLVAPTTEFVSSALGSPGDLLSLVNQLIAKPVSEKITGQEGVPFEETFLGKLIPTSEKVHKGFETLAEEKLRPETIGEELLGTTAGFLGSMIGLGAKGLTKPGKIPFTVKTMPPAIKNVLNAFAPASAFVATKKADLPPWLQASATIGTSLLMHRATGKSLKQINKDLYDKSSEMSKNVMLPSTGLENRLNNLESVMSKGLKTAPKSRILNLIDEMKAKASGGAVPLDDLIQYRKDIIETSKEFTKELRKGSEKFWKPLRAAVDNTIGDYEKLNPEFSKVFREANSLFRGINESKKIENFLSKNKFGSSVSGLASAYLMKTLKSMVGITPTTALVGAKSYFFINALRKNPGFRKAYKDILKNAANENVRGTSRALKNFNQIAEKDKIFEEEKKKDIFDELD